jgi:multidrug transporter EmrE-like cation transporter
MQNLVLGILYGILGQVGSFVQLQAALKYGWYPKYAVPLLLMAVPLSWFYIKSVQYFINAFNGSIWESRLLGFSIGIIMFTVLSAIMFKEPFTLKTIVSLLLGFLIVAIQVLWK